MRELAIELLGFVAAAVSIFVYVSNTMIPLRIAAVIANAMFAGYFYMRGIYPQCALNLVLLPLNFYRLRQMQDLVTAIKAASVSDFDFSWLRPVMKPRKLKKGQTLYLKGEEASEAFVIARGSISVPEKGAVLKDGALFGEIGMFADGHRRTASAVALEDTDLLTVSYSHVMELCAQNPTFCFYLMRLMMQRMQNNVELAERAGRAGPPEQPPVIATS